MCLRVCGATPHEPSGKQTDYTMGLTDPFTPAPFALLVTKSKKRNSKCPLLRHPTVRKRVVHTLYINYGGRRLPINVTLQLGSMHYPAAVTSRYCLVGGILTAYTQGLIYRGGGGGSHIVSFADKY